MDEEDIDIEGEETISSRTDPAPTSLTAVKEEIPDAKFAEEFQEPDWLFEDVPKSAADMDEKTRAVIAGMIAEEALYFGDRRPKLSALEDIPKKPKLLKKSDRKEPEPAKKRKSTVVRTVSHSIQWSREENELFRCGLERYGYGDWRSIARFIGTRNALQVKTHAKHYLGTKKIVETTSENVPREHDSASAEEDVDILDDENDDAPAIVLAPKGNLEPEKFETAETGEEVPEPSYGANAGLAPSAVVNSCSTTEKAENKLCAEESTHQVASDVSDPYESKDAMVVASLEHPGSDAADSEDEEEDHYELPTEEAFLDQEGIAEDEIDSNREFFVGNSSKTPDRYQKIRNFILNSWLKCRPRYLTKTSVRPGLKDCGDVNAIGRVHSYLERVGAINFGCAEVERARRPKPKRRHRTPTTSGPDEAYPSEAWAGSDGLRPRRPRVQQDHAANDSTSDDEHHSSRSNRLYYSRSTYDEQADDSNLPYDPFRLISLRRHTTSKPFQLRIHANALVTMDFHAHLAHTEIIGLLGGRFDVAERILEIHEAFPCNSLSTGLQCEMDPASEMEAREHFDRQNKIIVGWYHSHPTFEPNPSIRDIENQTAYQSLFRIEAENQMVIEPFVGVIVSPYDPRNPSNVSRFQYIHIENEWNLSHQYRLPFVCERTIEPQTEAPLADLFNQLSELVRKYRYHPNVVDLSLPFRRQEPGFSRLEKLLESLAANIYVAEDAQQAFLERIRALLSKAFGIAQGASNEPLSVLQ